MTTTESFGRMDPRTGRPVHLNRLIEVLASGQGAVGTFVSNGDLDRISAVGDAPYDFLIIEMEHSGFDFPTLRASLQFLLNRAQILRAGTLQPPVAPLVRIPANGRERNQWIIKQCLDEGVYGLVLPHTNSADDALSAVQAARYPQLRDASDRDPLGMRGTAPGRAQRYWGLTYPEYYQVADLWPLDHQGELLLMPLVEEEEGVHNIREIVRVPGIGAIFLGEVDLSVSMGYPGNPNAPVVQEAMAEVLAVCREAGMPAACLARTDNIEARAQAGWRILVAGPALDFGVVQQGLRTLGRG